MRTTQNSSRHRRPSERSVSLSMYSWLTTGMILFDSRPKWCLWYCTARIPSLSHALPVPINLCVGSSFPLNPSPPPSRWRMTFSGLRMTWATLVQRSMRSLPPAPASTGHWLTERERYQNYVVCTTYSRRSLPFLHFPSLSLPLSTIPSFSLFLSPSFPCLPPSLAFTLMTRVFSDL